MVAVRVLGGAVEGQRGYVPKVRGWGYGEEVEEGVWEAEGEGVRGVEEWEGFGIAGGFLGDFYFI